MLRSITHRLGLLAVPLALVACSGDDDQPTPAAPGTIVEVASSNGDFSTLVSAIEAAGLVETLSQDGPFTVFAPTDAAFDALPAGALDDLLANPEALREVLTYHVVSGRVTASEVVNLTSATTVSGADVEISVSDDGVRINGALVTQTDIETSNGVIHVIDAVLTPPDEAPGTIVDIAAANPDFSTLVVALEAAGLAETLSGEGPFTVFAPTNAAFEKIPQADLQALLDDVPALTDVLTYHVVAGDVRAADVIALRAADTVQGTSVVINAGDAVTVNDAVVTMTDIVASNGVIHVIDTVITPGTVADLIGYDASLSTLAAAVGAADLGATLSSEGPFTVFAPTDAAFDALPEGTVEALLQDIPALTDVLTYHVVPGAVSAEQVMQMSSATTVQGQDLSIAMSDGEVRVDDATVIETDIKATNGIVHVVDSVLLPAFE